MRGGSDGVGLISTGSLTSDKAALADLQQLKDEQTSLDFCVFHP